MFSKIFKASVTTLLLMAGPALADWNASPQSQGQSVPGARGQVDCPAGGRAGTVWGTGTYTSDSSICGAAQHYGWLPIGQSGTISYETTPGLLFYPGTSQNGIVSNDYGSWSLSFQITGASLSGQAQTINWGPSADALGIASNTGQSFSFFCAPNAGLSGDVWGTGTYTSDSSVCHAAQHAGLIVPQLGGPVRLLVTGHQPSYTGTLSHGINSSSYGEWPRSFTFQ
ncbi:hypothetical protein A8B78_07360 [Jannaschia sp. EhC01]|nr:hypothetical protein A8B78_07360 [Jannaschia sp. EhC01]